MKKLFKFRMLYLKWVTFYLFPKERYSLGITFDRQEGEYPLLTFSFLIFEFNIIFADKEYFYDREDYKQTLKDFPTSSLGTHNLNRELYEDI